MSHHHRNYMYRPPRRADDNRAAGWGTYLRFLRAYLYPHRWSVLLCLSLVSANACSVYLMSFYGKVVVDKILCVRSATAGAPAAPAGGDRSSAERVWTDDHMRPGRNPPTQGIERRMTTENAATETGSERPPGAGRMLLLFFVIYVGTQLTLNHLARLSQRTQIHVAQRMTAHMREDMHRKVLELSTSYHKSHTPGRLLSRIVSDVEVIQGQMTSTIMTAGSSIAMILLGTGILLFYDWRMCLIAVAVTPIYAAVYGWARPRLRALNRELRHTNSCMYGLTSQKIEAMKAIQAYGREGHERLAFHRLTACFLRDALYQQRLSAGVSRAASVVSALGTGTIFLVGAKFVMENRMSLGQMMFIYGTTANLFGPVLQLSQLNVTISNLLVVMQRVVDVLDHPVEIADAPDAVDFPKPVRQGISLQHVGFTYGKDPDAEPVLRDINLEIPAGTWLCIMGASGAGKTTLLYLLSRLYEPTAGTILIDGQPLTKIKMNALRRAVGFVPQEAQIFSGTLRDNIAYGYPEATPSEILNAATAAELHEFIMTMPVKYETVIGERGTSLSGGQRQRLSLSRALLTTPDVLVLDDCTSALDAETEQKIQKTLQRVLQDRTAIIVSQRVSMAKRCHRIAVIENGMIGEVGTHEELLANRGFYARLHAQQTE